MSSPCTRSIGPVRLSWRPLSLCLLPTRPSLRLDNHRVFLGTWRLDTTDSYDITPGRDDVESYKKKKLIFPEQAECGCGFFGPGKLFEKHTAQTACKIPHHDPTNLLKAIIFAHSKGLSSFVSAAAEVIFQAVTQDTSESATAEMTDLLRLERFPGFKDNEINGVVLSRTDEGAGPAAGVASNKYQLIKALQEERKGRRPDDLDWRYASVLGPYLNVFL